MRCPTPCIRCGEDVELHSMAFHTAYCDCSASDSCTHGLCDQCTDDVLSESDPDAARQYRADVQDAKRERDT